MAGKETVRPYLTMSGGSCDVDHGASSAATDLDFGRVPEETREAAWQQRENQAANRVHKCHICGFGFTDAEAFQNHGADHLLGKNHYCSKCGKLYMHNYQLARHLGTHGEPFYECGVCGKKYHTKDHTRRHMRSCRVKAQGREAVEGSPP